MLHQDFYSIWDSTIRSWFNDKTVLLPLMDRKNTLSLDHLPEPYYGDMDNNSIVIINLNPGTGLSEQCWDNQDKANTFVNDVKKLGSYRDYVKSFPLLLGNGPADSVNWWESRYKWIKRILDQKGLSNTKKSPFAIELVPLHSKSFDVSGATEYVARIKQNNKIDLIGAIEYAILKSEAHMGLAVGKPIYDALCANGFKDVPGGLGQLEKPLSTKRFYHVIEKTTATGVVRVLCTWSYGSNNAPALIFKDKEGEILDKYFNR